eukprot:gene15004-16553_t
MDLLGSILGSMDAPPQTVADKEALKKAKEAKAKAAKLKQEEKQKHDVAEVAGLVSFAFGENVDRYIMIWKKEFAPSDAELEARRNGEDWDEEKEKLAVALAKKAGEEEQEQRDAFKKSRKRNNQINEPEKYFDKYAKILGGDSGVDAAKATKTNAAYGMVPSKNKEDQRSIEETLNQIRAKKKQKSDQV